MGVEGDASRVLYWTHSSADVVMAKGCSKGPNNNGSCCASELWGAKENLYHHGVIRPLRNVFGGSI